MDTKIDLLGIKIDNPVIPASGTFSYGYDFNQYYDINKLGTFSFKGTTKEERFGNKCPKIADCDSGMINSVGLTNPGIEKVINCEIPKIEKVFHKKIMANVSGFSKEEYEYVVEKLDKVNSVGWIEVNISCPNVKGGGMAFGSDKESAALITKAVRKKTKKPIIMKLSPNVTDIVQIAKAVEFEGADGVSMINTLGSMRIDIKTRKPVLNNISGGLSGPCIFPVALKKVYDTYKAVKIPIIGMGGVDSCEKLIEMMLAGARAVEIGALNLIDPWGCEKIVDSLEKTMKKYKIDSLSSIVGGAHF